MNLKVILPLVVFLAIALVVQADDSPAPSAYGLLCNKYKAEREALTSDPSAENGDDLKARKLELQKVYTHRFLQLARQHPSDDLWLDCLIWIGVEGVPGPDRDAMIDFMRSHAAEVDNAFQLQLFMSELIPLESDCLNRALSDMAEDHPSKGVRGASLYALAVRTKRLAERNGSAKGCKQAETLLQRVIDDYPDVHTYRGENKDNAVDLIEQLRSPMAIGKPAPETKGTDIDGLSFDLAEQRGKVVVLSFSGHWCGPCRAMHPIEKELFNKYPRHELAIVEINSDKKRI